MRLIHIGQISRIIFDDLFASAVTGSNKCQQRMYNFKMIESFSFEVMATVFWTYICGSFDCF